MTYICHGCKSTVSEKCMVFIGPPCIVAEDENDSRIKVPVTYSRRYWACTVYSGCIWL